MSLLACGCGTVMNLADDYPRPYGGLRRDLQAVESADHLPSEIGAYPIVGLWAADVCLSLVADTLTYPMLRARQKALGDRAVLDAVEPADAARPQYSAGAGARRTEGEDRRSGGE
jgi:hypothetical protein